MFQVWLSDTVPKVTLAKNNTLSIYTSNTVKQGFFVGGAGIPLGSLVLKPNHEAKTVGD
jgi:hypothetical protein